MTAWVPATATVANEWCSWSSTRCRRWMGTQRRGCAFVNAYAELGDSGHPAVPVIRAEKAWMRTLFDALTGDPDVGAHVHLIYEGTLVVLTAGADPEAAAEARRAVRSVMARVAA